MTLMSGWSANGALVSAAPPVLLRALQDDGARALAGEVGAARQAVVPAADDDRVVDVRSHARNRSFPSTKDPIMAA